MNCLVADDVPIILKGEIEVARNVLGEDTRIFEAENSNKILEIVNENHIDIAILDVEMPTENGIETTKKIKAIQPDIKIILTSGDEKYESEALAAGAIGFIVKPMSEKDLQKCLQVLMFRKQNMK